MAEVIQEKEHARLSPSSADRWMVCPGSLALEESLKIKDKPNKYAAEGTVAHEVHEKALLGKQRAEEYIGQTFEADGFKFKVNQEMADAVQESLDYILERISDAVDFGYRVEILVEVRCSLKHLGIPGLDGGTSDVVLIFWDDTDIACEIEIIDYKHGQGVAVEVVDNRQALCYANGVIALPELNGYGFNEGIRITISQPRAHHPDGRIRSWTVDKDHLLNWEDDELIPKAKATHEKNAPLVPSDKGCRFCRAAGSCEALYNKTQEIAIADFKDDSFPDPKVMTAEQKMVVMEHAVMIKAFIVAVEAQVQHEVDEGSNDYESAFKLVRKTTQRKLTDKAFDELDSPLLDYLSEDDMYEKKPKGLGAIEKALKATGKKPKEVKEIMSEVTIKPEGGLVIAPLSDKRVAVQPALTGDFANLD